MSEFNQGTQFTSSQSSNTNDLKPNNNLILSIVSTVLGLCSPCCIGLILGVVAIVFSTQVDSKYNMGDYRAAADSAQKAKIFALIALGLFAINMVYLLFLVATGGMDAMFKQYEEILKYAK